MTYVIEFWGKNSQGDEFREKLQNKSSKPKNWLPKMRELYGGRIDFDNVTDFGYHAQPLRGMKK